MDSLDVKREAMPGVDPIFVVGDYLTVVVGGLGGRWEGLNGMVVRVTPRGVVLVNDAGFCCWFSSSDLVHTYGPYW